MAADLFSKSHIAINSNINVIKEHRDFSFLWLQCVSPFSLWNAFFFRHRLAPGCRAPASQEFLRPLWNPKFITVFARTYSWSMGRFKEFGKVRGPF
jgi:hypothetical protein